MPRSFVSKLPEPPYYAVIFPSQRSQNETGYRDVINRLIQTAMEQPGFLGMEAARGEDGFGIHVSYWESLEAFAAWSKATEVLVAQASGRDKWFDFYEVRIAKVERSIGLGTPR